jgi:hypothetical protein
MNKRPYPGPAAKPSPELLEMPETNCWKAKQIFSLANASVKENPSPERDFNDMVQDSAYDLQKFSTRRSVCSARSFPDVSE